MINQDQSERGSIIIHVKHYIYKVNTDSQENLENLPVKRPIFLSCLRS